jgi:hypothetical protein
VPQQGLGHRPDHHAVLALAVAARAGDQQARVVGDADQQRGGRAGGDLLEDLDIGPGAVRGGDQRRQALPALALDG